MIRREKEAPRARSPQESVVWLTRNRLFFFSDRTEIRVDIEFSPAKWFQPDLLSYFLSNYVHHRKHRHLGSMTVDLMMLIIAQSASAEKTILPPGYLFFRS